MTKKNIVLIGLMGCGKSTVGRALSYRFKMPYVDLDAWLERKEGRSISEIFAQDGEAAFREIEHRVVEEASAWSGHIISTGGGVVLREDNMKALRKNAIVVFINRPVEEIVKNVNIRKRPLLANGPEKLFQIRREREPLYRKYADLEINNCGSFRDGVQNAYRRIRRAIHLDEQRTYRVGRPAGAAAPESAPRNKKRRRARRSCHKK